MRINHSPLGDKIREEDSGIEVWGWDDGSVLVGRSVNPEDLADNWLTLQELLSGEELEQVMEIIVKAHQRRFPK